jgi:hypothetical protein
VAREAVLGPGTSGMGPVMMQCLLWMCCCDRSPRLLQVLGSARASICVCVFTITCDEISGKFFGVCVGLEGSASPLGTEPQGTHARSLTLSAVWACTLTACCCAGGRTPHTRTDALLQAHRRGVAVRIITDNDQVC